ncbi:trans-sialidase, putative [Trypanosoma cruzi marinkellei]|uniref:Trans-sialidase, putative n=1 Tax=Trypanosoma cruzi marinkellei TaxID=85056 RepID=K2N2T5_TRYCR|nr:trans-sialidase, putative [Trypanosoma cruzi marinkellei]
MLSRVAAVKAPRTHNRRRVTGCSGGRREGRESERQRPNMSRRVFASAVLLLVLMMCCGSGAADAEVMAATPGQFKWEGITDGVTVKSLGASGLVKVGDDVFAVAEAQCMKESDGASTFTGIASQIIAKVTADQQMELPKEFLKDAKTKTQVLLKGGSEGKKVDVSRPTTVVKESEIYMLVGKYSPTTTGVQESVAVDSGLLLVKGDVSSGGQSDKKVLWKDTKDVPRASFGAEHQSLEGLIGGGGSGVETEGKTLVFPVEGTKTVEDGKKKNVSLLIYSEDATSWTLSKGVSADGCSAPSS